MQYVNIWQRFINQCKFLLDGVTRLAHCYVYGTQTNASYWVHLVTDVRVPVGVVQTGGNLTFFPFYSK